MKTTLLLFLFASAVWAQQDVASILEQQVELQRDRVTAVEQKLKLTDNQIERRIERVLGNLVAVNDGPDSRTKVLQAKQAMFDALKRNIEFYVRERGQRFASLYQPSSRLTKEAVLADVEWLNARIEKRVGQALALVTSLPAEKEVVRTTTRVSGGEWEERTNPAYTHQRRVMDQAGQFRDQVYKDLKASVDRIQRSRVELNRALGYAKTAEGRQVVEELLERNTALVAKRQEQIQAALGKTNPGAKAINGKAADALLQQIQEEKSNNARDNAEWIRLKNERDLESSRLRLLQDKLALYRP